MVKVSNIDVRRLIEALCVLKPFVNSKGIMVSDSVLFNITDGVLNLVGSDRIKIARFLFGNVSCKQDLNFIVPASEIESIMSSISDKDFIDMDINNNMAYIKCGDTILKSFAHSFWKEDYPDYKKLFKGCDLVLGVDCDRLKKALRSALCLYRQSDKVSMEMDIEYHNISDSCGEFVLSVSLSMGDVVGIFKIKTYDKCLRNMKFRVNPFALMDMVDMVSASSFIIPTFNFEVSSTCFEGDIYNGPLFIKMSDRLETLVLTL